jgi:hypothetical protein
MSWKRRHFSMKPKNMRRQFTGKALMRRQFRRLGLIALEEVREILDDEIRRKQG